MNEYDQALHQAITQGKIHLGVIGLGYVGLPLALTFIEKAQIRVTGFDIDAQRVAALQSGHSYIEHLGASRVAAANKSGQFSACCDFSRLKEVDAVVVTVPTPLTAQREPDLSHVIATTECIREHLRPGQLIILQSTTYPGTTREVVRPLLERSGLRCGTDFFLAFAPEREDPGNQQFPTGSIPKVVGGVDATSTELAVALFRSAIDHVVPVASAEVAEAAKLTENVFRAVNVALVNELKIVYDRMGIDIWQVLDAAATKPFGFMRFTPGPGLGGHCIPIDPYYLSWKAKQHGISTRFVELAAEVNRTMPNYVVQKLASALTGMGVVLNNARVLIVGLAYKRDIDDPRESPAFALIDLLLKQHASVSYHDPHIAQAPTMRSWPDLPPLRSVGLSVELLRAVDAVVICTNHTAVDYELIAEHSPLIVDTRGVYREPQPNVIRA